MSVLRNSFVISPIVGLAGALLLSACAVVESYEDGALSERRFVVGAPAIRIDPVVPEGGSLAVDAHVLGAVSEPTSTAVGATRFRYYRFPTRCGAVFVEPSDDAVERILAMGDFQRDCIVEK